MPMMVDAFVPLSFLAMIRFQQWDQLLQVNPPDAKLAASTALWHFGRAMALTAKPARRPDSVWFDGESQEQGKMEAAQMLQKEFKAAWKNADVTLRLGDL
jgi:hypothetical protein